MKKKLEDVKPYTYSSTRNITMEYINDLIADQQNGVVDLTIYDPEKNAPAVKYDIYSMLAIKRAIQKFLNGCPERKMYDEQPEKEIFTYIYTKLAHWASKDELEREIRNNASKEFKQYSMEYLKVTNGIEGVMVAGFGTPKSFAETLRNLLAETGIIAVNVPYNNKVYNKTEGDGKGSKICIDGEWFYHEDSRSREYDVKYLDKHNVATHVCLDGQWYYCDIYNDLEFIKQGLIAPNFLISYSKFNEKAVPKQFPDTHKMATLSVSEEEQKDLIELFKDQINAELNPKKENNKGWFQRLINKVKNVKTRGDDE